MLNKSEVKDLNELRRLEVLYTESVKEAELKWHTLEQQYMQQAVKYLHVSESEKTVVAFEEIRKLHSAVNKAFGDLCTVFSHLQDVKTKLNV